MREVNPEKPPYPLNRRQIKLYTMASMDAKILFDRNLVARVLNGDSDAQFDFYALVNAFISRVCAKYGDFNGESAEDISQEICLSLHRNLPRIENLEKWLTGAIRRRLSGLVRLGKTYPCREIGDRAAVAPEHSAALWDAVRRLSALCKRIIIFHYLYGYSQRSIARSEGLSEGTLPLRKKQCMDRLFILYHGEYHEG